jgi:hypothetical protein
MYIYIEALFRHSERARAVGQGCCILVERQIVADVESYGREILHKIMVRVGMPVAGAC